MWVMTKKLRGKQYLYLYRSVWEDGKPVSKFVRYLGPKADITEVEIVRIVKEEEKRLRDEKKKAKGKD